MYYLDRASPARLDDAQVTVTTVDTVHTMYAVTTADAVTSVDAVTTADAVTRRGSRN